ncbi:MAG TPA: cytochrome c [Chloroflexota bacterium]|nr:cytochrome c [Chloroflexota bacterium]
MFRNRVSYVTAVAVLLLVILVIAGCSSGWQKMVDQPRKNPLDPSRFFTNGASALSPQSDTVPRGYLQDDVEFETGKTSQGKLVTTFPFTITLPDLDRGRERYDIYCAPCHGRTGDGDGPVVARGFSTPPTFHSDRLRQAPVGHLFDVITNGYGDMPDYKEQIPPRDRWLIVAYIRALQFSENAPIADVPVAIRGQLESSNGPILVSTLTPGTGP